MEKDYNQKKEEIIKEDIAALQALLDDVNTLNEKRKELLKEQWNYKKNIRKYRPKLDLYDKENYSEFKKSFAENAPSFPTKTAIITALTVITLPKMIADGRQYAKEKAIFDDVIFQRYCGQHKEIRAQLEQEDKKVLEDFQEQLDKARTDYEYYQNRVDSSRVIGNRYKDEDSLERIISLLESREAVSIEQAIQILEAEQLQMQMELMRISGAFSDEDD